MGAHVKIADAFCPQVTPTKATLFLTLINYRFISKDERKTRFGFDVEPPTDE